MIANLAKIWLPRIAFSSAIAVILFPLVIYSGLLLRRPPLTAQQKQLFPGITYQRIADLNPRPVMMHIVTIDLSIPAIKLRVTPGQPGDDAKDIPAQTTSFGKSISYNSRSMAAFFILVILITFGILSPNGAIALMWLVS